MVKIFIQREKRQGKQYREKLADGMELEMVAIPAGMFVMGSPENELERDDDESPQHTVTITRSFYMGKYPITQGQWKAVVESTTKINQDLDSEPCHFQEDFEQIGDHWLRPVEQISWEDAVEFCARLSQKTARTYCLPSEAEWEYACRGISLNNITVEDWNQKYHQPFHFGKTISPKVANCNDGENYRNQTTPVGYFSAANTFGLYDLHGNVWEWCGDDWAGDYNEARKQEYYKSQIDNPKKVTRGGCSASLPGDCRSAIREFIKLSYRWQFYGFRVVCDSSKSV